MPIFKCSKTEIKLFIENRKHIRFSFKNNIEDLCAIACVGANVKVIDENSEYILATFFIKWYVCYLKFIPVFLLLPIRIIYHGFNGTSE